VDATKDFEIIVVNQEQLNTVDLANLAMKKTKGGYLSGNMIADEDKYQNYFLILRSATEEPVEVDLEIKIRAIEPRPAVEQENMPPPPPPQPSATNFDTATDNATVLDDFPPAPAVAQSTSHVYLMVIGLIVVGAVAGYYYWKNCQKPATTTLAIDDDVRSVCSKSSSSSSSSHSSSSTEEKGILDTLLHKKSA
jgi:hypothetical protein